MTFRTIDDIFDHENIDETTIAVDALLTARRVVARSLVSVSPSSSKMKKDHELKKRVMKLKKKTKKAKKKTKKMTKKTKETKRRAKETKKRTKKTKKRAKKTKKKKRELMMNLKK